MHLSAKKPMTNWLSQSNAVALGSRSGRAAAHDHDVVGGRHGFDVCRCSLVILVRLPLEAALFLSSRGLSLWRCLSCNECYDLIRRLERRLALAICEIDQSLCGRYNLAVQGYPDTHRLITIDLHWIAVGSGQFKPHHYCLATMNANDPYSLSKDVLYDTHIL
jgi:hypothetical protein